MPIRRALKNIVKSYSDAQVKVREATSNDPWGPSSTLMSGIADLTYNVVAFTEIMQMIWKRLNDHGKNWRHVYKSLVLLDYIIKTGSEKVAQQCKENIFAIQTLKDFQYVEENKDQGMNVREKAKQMVALLKDDERLKNERAKALKAKERFAQNTMGIGSTGTTPPNEEVFRYETTPGQFGGGGGAGGAGSGGMPPTNTSPTLHTSSGGYADPYGGATGANDPAELEAARPTTAGEEELQLQLALAMSKEEAEEDERRRRGDDVKLQMALEESKKENRQQQPVAESTGPRNQPSETLLDLVGNQANQSQAKADPWGSSPLGQSGTAAPVDPWGAPPPNPPAPADPWGSPAKTAAPAASPWSPPAHTVPPSDPWKTPATGAGSSSGSSPWGSPAISASQAQTTSNASFSSGFATTNGTSSTPSAANTLDDAFDMLSSRNKSNGTGSTDAFDLLGGGTTNNIQPNNAQSNPFDLGDLGSALDANDKKNRTAADFLGENANLVNLDMLVTRPTPEAGTNPFGVAPLSAPAPAPAPNPFGSQQPVRVPMNQMQAQTGFTQTSSTILPAPLLPSAMAAQPIQPQSNNPFL